MCPDDDQILLLLEGRLPEDGVVALETHLDACESCRRLVGAAAHTQSADPDPTLPVAEVRPAARILSRGAAVGRYLVLSPLGQGAMGTVYAAYDPELDRRVAVKLLLTARGSDGARRLLVREARGLGRLSHPNVVQVHDVGEHEGSVFVAMELVDGQSLDDWCQESPRPRWQAILSAYIDAARGLSAAHAKGLVHRDIKPANILRGSDGRVRVADFGLVMGQRRDAREEGREPGGEAAVDDRLTATGALVGTPLYMAPEQHLSARMTAACDQYSLCVALHEGLYGVASFSTGPGPLTLDRLLAAKQAGPNASPPEGPSDRQEGRIPAWIYRALARGLAPDPADRYPSMDALIAALEADPEARPRARRRLGVIAAAVAAVIAAGAALGIRNGALRDPCAHPQAELAGVWDEGVKGRVRAAFLGTGRPYAEGTLTRVIALLDLRSADWTAMRRAVCEASRAGAQRREIVGLRDECLDRQLGALKALTTLAGEKPDVEVLDKAVPAALGLAPIASCADVEALTARVPPPEDPALRARVASLDPRVDRVEALYRAGQYKEGLVVGEPLLAETATVAYAPLRARLGLWVGELRGATGDYEGAKSALREAAAAAAEGRDDVLMARAWARVLFILGERQRRFDQAAEVRSFGPTLLSRAHDERTELDWLKAEALFLTRKGSRTEARALHERAVKLGEKILGPDHFLLANPLTNLGILLVDMGEPALAKAVEERALAITEKALGPEHPYVAVTLNNLGAALAAMGDRALAREAYEHALRVWERSLGPDHPHVAQALHNVGNELFETGEWAQARAHYERSLAIREKALGPEHPDVAQALYGVGSVLRELDQLPGSAEALERSRAILEKSLGPEHGDVAFPLAALGRTLIRQGRLDEAQRLLDRALVLRARADVPQAPALVEPLLGLGELHLARRRPEQALPLLERAVSIDPSDAHDDVQLALAEALWQAGKDRPRARALAEQARAAYERLHHGPGLARSTRWLSHHPAP